MPGADVEQGVRVPVGQWFDRDDVRAVQAEPAELGAAGDEDEGGGGGRQQGADLSRENDVVQQERQ